MRFALLGRSIAHSLSPEIYRSIFTCPFRYDLLDYGEIEELPQLQDLQTEYDGINITSPYKRHYVSSVKIYDEKVIQLGAINTISFTPDLAIGTNTDLIAVEQILERTKATTPRLYLTILGAGVMAKLTVLVAKKLLIPFEELNRANGLISDSDLSSFYAGPGHWIINACSRDFVFSGKIHSESHFWDYNYRFLPHQTSLPGRVKTYVDGQEMLWLQAQAAVEFWRTTNPKLKC